MKRRPCGGARITRWREITSLKLTLSAVAVPAGTTGVALARDNVQISGSSTVLPYATIVAEAFGENFEFPTPFVEGGGSGAGRKKMCEGVGENTIDIANSSSRISKSDIELCAANGETEIMEVRIGYDGIVFASKVDGHDSRVRFLLPAEVPAMSAARLSDIWRLRTPRQSLLIWALLLVAIMGSGLLAGVVAIGLRSIGFIGKLLYEAIEEVDVNQVEAVTATGASRAGARLCDRTASTAGLLGHHRVPLGHKHPRKRDPRPRRRGWAGAEAAILAQRAGLAAGDDDPDRDPCHRRAVGMGLCPGARRDHLIWG